MGTEPIEHVCATVGDALHAAYHMNADPFEDEPARFGVAWPDGRFVYVTVTMGREVENDG